MAVHLKDITQDNWRQILGLKVTDEQQSFVADNAYSMLQAHYEAQYKLVPLAIYDDDTLVGFVMYGAAQDNGREIWAIWRLMIDVQHQRKGYGRAALRQTIDRMRSTIEADEFYISFMPDNISAKTLYMSFGFEDTGLMDDGEVIYKLTLSKTS